MSSFGKHRKQREPLSGQKLRERAFDLLSRRDHSERELAKKLREKGAVLEEIPPLLKDLKERKFLDDARLLKILLGSAPVKPGGCDVTGKSC